ncbi:MAG: hypothetical protein LAO56_11540 [Acidobacteriia bacterium]|nr:hypothetical protein [Terriglobia bacterium]
MAKTKKWMGTFVKDNLSANQQLELLVYLIDEVVDDDEQWEDVVEEVERLTGKRFNDPEE